MFLVPGMYSLGELRARCSPDKTHRNRNCKWPGVNNTCQTMSGHGRLSQTTTQQEREVQ